MDKLILFSLGSNKKLINKIAKKYSLEIGEVYQEAFKDGEMMVKSLSNVQGKNVLIIQSTCKPACINLFKILLLLDSLKRMKPNSITLAIPYFGFSRQERVAWHNEPISCQVVANILNHSGADKVITFDLHHPVINSFFSIPFVGIKTTSIFTNYYRKYLQKHDISLKDVAIIAPDHGANERAHLLADSLNISDQVVILTKSRPRPNYSEVLGIDGDVNNKFCIIIDDIIDTGGTIINGAKLLYQNGASNVLVGATHGVFSNHAVEKLKNAKINDIAVCNTIEKRYSKDVNVLDIESLLMKNI